MCYSDFYSFEVTTNCNGKTTRKNERIFVGTTVLGVT